MLPGRVNLKCAMGWMEKSICKTSEIGSLDKSPG